MSSPVTETILPNGLHIICEQVPTAPVVALQAWVGVGSADETPKEAGLAHLHEHMLFKGTSRRGVGEIAREIEANGGEINAWTSFDQTVYHVTMASGFFAAGLDVLADAIQHSSFDAEELAREKEVVLEEIRRGDDQPTRRLSQHLFTTAFGKHPYGLPVIGTSKSVSGFARKDLLAFYKKWYVPNNIVFVIVGDVDPPKAIAAARKVFGRFKSRSTRRIRRVPAKPHTAPRTFSEITDAGDIYSAMALPIPQLLHEHTPGLDLLSEILGGSEASRLFERVQAEKQLVSSVYAHAYTPKDPGLFMIGANPFPGKEMEALRAVWEEVVRLRDQGVSSEELERAKLSIESESIYSRQTVQGRARKWGYSLQSAGTLEFEDRYLDALRRVSATQIAELARNYLREERITAGLFVPGKQTGKAKAAAEKKLASDLKKVFTPTRKVRTARKEKPGHNIELHRLSNGIRVIAEKSDMVPVVAFRASCLGGSRYETPEDAGVFRFVSEMLPRGAGGRSATQIRHEVEAIAGSADGVAGRNTNGADVHCLSRFWRRGYGIFRDLLLAPAFPEDEIEKVRAETIAALDRENDSLSQVLFQILRKEIYGEHPYGFRLLGEKETIAGFTADKLRRAHERTLDPERMVLSVVGDIRPEEIFDAMEADFGHLKVAPGKPPRIELSRLSGRHYTEKILDRAQAHLAIGFRGTTLESEDRFALEVMNTILAGQGGRLFMELRDKLSLAYSVSSFAMEGIEAGLFAGYIGTSPEKLETAYLEMWRQFARIREETVSRDELQRARRHLLGAEAIDHQSCGARAALYGLNELYGLGYLAHEEYRRKISSVSAMQVQEAARRYLTPDAAVLAVVRPEKTPSLQSQWMGAGSAPRSAAPATSPRAARARLQRK